MTDSARCSSWKCCHRERRGLAPDCVLSSTVSPYCFDLGSGEVRSAPARKTPEIPDRMERTPGISTPVLTGAVLASSVAPLAALTVCSGVGGDSAPEVPGGGLFGVVPGAPGVEPGAVDELGGAAPEDVDGGVLLSGADEFPAPDAPELGCVASMPRQRRYDSEMPWLTVF